MTNEEKINLIGQKILILSNNLDKYQQELEVLKAELLKLQQNIPTIKAPIQQPIIVPPVEQKIIKTEVPDLKPEPQIIQPVVPPVQQPHFTPTPPKPASSFNFEAFIGGKLITIIGIIILVIGLGIGVKYAVDNGMIGPLGRIAIAYLAGGTLIAIAFKLKENYKAFSAVLLSGGMASLYFTTFAAYSMYNLFPREAAFGIMLVFTAFTVFAATMYNLQVIGIIGLVGAYAVPMLLNNHSGKIEIMFAYMLVINIGILFLSFKKYWQILNYFAFGLTWLIVAAWASTNYDHTQHTLMLMCFSFAFFLIFYISSMSYKILKQEKFVVMDVIHLLLNSFIFFSVGYATLSNERDEDFLGLFTLANALVHLTFSFIVFKNKLLDRKLFYLLIAMVLTFVTIAVPVQLEGNWVTLFWSTEAVLLFVIGRYKQVRFYEWLGLIMIGLSIFSLMDDWNHAYYAYDYDNTRYKDWMAFANIHMLTSLFFLGSLGSILFVHHKKALSTEERNRFKIYTVIDYTLPFFLFVISYAAFSNELNAFFTAKYQQSYLHVPAKEAWAEPGAFSDVYDSSWTYLKNIASTFYTVVFFSITTLIVIKKTDNKIIHWAFFSLNLLVILIFLTAGLTELSELRSYCLNGTENTYYPLSKGLLSIRYLGMSLFGIFLYLTHLLLKTATFSKFSIGKVYTGCLLHLFIIIVLSVELVNINILNNQGTEESYYHTTKTVYKLGFTALWGIYSFIMIAVGIFKRNRIMRISAISLFGITLIKLCTFDTWDLSTGYKVIAFILLGVILLVVAFLYQKFKTFIFGDDEEVAGN